MSDWREHARRQEWRRIAPYHLLERDQVELIEMLQYVVPRHERGHGVETFEGFIAPEEAGSRSDYEAARLLQRLQRTQADRVRWSEREAPLGAPAKFAAETLQELGINFEGYEETYLFWHLGSHDWRQIPGRIGATILRTRIEIRKLVRESDGDARDAAALRLKAWESLYPWRTCNSLRFLYQADRFEPNTPIWHALRIFDCYEQFSYSLSATEAEYGHDCSTLLKMASRSALEIGQAFEALKKKPYEPHALRGIAVSDAAGRGGAKRRRNLEPATRAVLAEMKRLIDNGQSISRAADLTAQKGIGTSKDANRKLWRRHMPK